MQFSAESIVSIFSIAFQGLSLVEDIDPIIYAVVSLGVLLIQLAFEFDRPGNTRSLLSITLVVTAFIMCVLSVASNFYDKNIQTLGRLLTTAGVIQESMLFGVGIGKQDVFAAANNETQSTTLNKPNRPRKKKKTQ